MLPISAVLVLVFVRPPVWAQVPTDVLPPVSNANQPAVAAAVPGLLDDSAVDAAIAIGQGRGAGFIGTPTCWAHTAFMDFSAMNGGYDVAVVGPMGRVALAAQDAKKKYLPFARGNVTDDMRRMTLSVAIDPQPPSFTSGVWHHSAPATHVVVKLKGREDVVAQPLNVQLVDRSWNNAFGATFTSRGAVATFPAAAFMLMPPGDIDIVVITDYGERRCKIGKKERANIR
jgi:hypothetical protein